MSYQVLARKWRPRNFSTLVGQEHVVRALTHALNEQRLHHAYLFTGTRGVGKTTIARILAKSLNCEAGVSASPCGQCSACQEIDAGRFVDLLEVDAATNTRVEEMRQLLENAVYAPTRGRYKVYVIDEVHMLSSSAFNAMLKTLEEPPEHVKFILATTDPQKIPVTVLSRCLQFNLKQMPVATVVEHLGRILHAEGIPFDAAALNPLGRAAEGSMRDALSLLDQAIAHGGGRLELAAVQDMLGTVDATYLLELLESLADGNSVQMLQVADTLQTRGLSCASALQELAVLLTRLQLLQLVPQSGLDDHARLAPLASRFSPDYVQLAYQIVIQGRQELALAPDEYSGFIMVLLRLLAFVPYGQADSGASPDSSPRASRHAKDASAAVRPAVEGPVDVPAVSAQLDGGGRATVSAALSVSAPHRRAVPLPAVPVTAPVHEVASRAAARPSSEPPPPWEDLPSSEGASLQDAPSVAVEAEREDAARPVLDSMESSHAEAVEGAQFTPVQPEVVDAAASEIMPGRAVKAGDATESWSAQVGALALSGMARELAQNCDLLGWEGEVCTLRLAPAYRYLLTKPAQDKVQQALAEYRGTRVLLQIEVADTDRATPAQIADEARRVRQEAALKAIDTDRFVMRAKEILEASVVEASVKPIG